MKQVLIICLMEATKWNCGDDGAGSFFGLLWLDGNSW